MKTKLVAVSLSLLALLSVFSGAHALAVTVDFTDMDRGPSVTLQINGVTISGGIFFPPDVHSLPATVSGVGLGSAAIGSWGSVDRIQWGSYSMYIRESLSLTVSGNINSVTIKPYFSILGSNEDIFVPFDVSANPGVGFLPFQTVLSDEPFTITNFYPSYPADTIQIGLSASFGNEYVVAYLESHPGAIAQFGFSITSLDYTPAVPETSTVILFGLGLVGIGWLCRKNIA